MRDKDLLKRYVAECIDVMDRCQRDCFSQPHGDRQQALIELDLVLDCIEQAGLTYGEASESMYMAGAVRPELTRLVTADWVRIFDAVCHPDRDHAVNLKHRATLQNNLLAALQCLLALWERTWDGSNKPVSRAIQAVASIDLSGKRGQPGGPDGPDEFAGLF
jgi:hypothetical protein